MAHELIEITAADGAIVQPEWLMRAESIHRQLRPSLPPAYLAKLKAVFANGGRMVLVAEGDEVRGIAIWRIIENTYEGRRLYIDDLVTDEKERSKGFGKALFKWLEERARHLECSMLALDSGMQRAGAHKFYFREGMSVFAFCFRKALNQ